MKSSKCFRESKGAVLVGALMALGIILIAIIFCAWVTAVIAGCAHAETMIRDDLPKCGKSAIVIFDATHFDGWVYVHDISRQNHLKAIRIDKVVRHQMREIAQDGQQPAVCQVNGIQFATILQ